MAISIVNARSASIRNFSNYIYCGRGSALGNPFIMYKEVDRDKVCDQYQEWFYERVDEINFLDKVDMGTTGKTYSTTPQEDQLIGIFRYMIDSDKGVRLGCFCTPKRCHCDTIKNFIENKLEELEK